MIVPPDQEILEIILIQLKFEKSYSKDLIEIITKNIRNSLSEILSSSINVSKELWNYTMKQCIGYLEIVCPICSLIAKRYSKCSLEIADLILKYNF